MFFMSKENLSLYAVKLNVKSVFNDPNQFNILS